MSENSQDGLTLDGEEDVADAADASMADAKSAADPEPVADEPVRIRVKRQWVNLRGSSLDARVGDDLVGTMGNDLRAYVGKPRVAVLATTSGAPADVIEAIRRDLADVGFHVEKLDLPSGPGASSTEALEAVYEGLAESGATGDDVAVAVGDVRALSTASFACRSWCGGMTLAQVPLDPACALLAGVTPLALDLPGAERMVSQDGSARYVYCDLDVVEAARTDEAALLARALFVTSAMADSDKAFGRLFDRANDIAALDRAIICEQLVDCMKSRGKVISSTSVAVRQSIDYGMTFVHALRPLVGEGVPTSTLLAEAVRFLARLSVAQGGLSVDDMFAQDELLDRLGLGYVECEMDATAMAAALKAERFRRSNKFMLELPRSLGRVRLAAVEDDQLAEHTAAWCAAR
ncbi:3-dehydroquinate synthase [Olsenella sp. Marseille-P4559]|uniref:3-dehydroquinate synthase n=1 Tax=Olsenella sp. Marseille-P4559 TaxID=2364795 RepID=UPI00102FA4DD|nr:3-dehydroquinate synthase [Olsenella sp. Marseille-P4559]